MKFLLPIFILIVLLAGTTSVSAQTQSCNPSEPFVAGKTCPVGNKCAATNGGAGRCVPEVCSPACKSGETCIVGQCVKASDTGGGTKPSDTGGGTKPSDTGGGTKPSDTGTGPSSGEVGLVNPLKSIDSLPQLLTALLAAVVQIGTIILTLALVYVGFLFVVAQGSEEKIRDAKGALLWTLIGGLILLGASAIQAVITATVGKL